MAGPIPIKTSKPCPPQFLRNATSSVRYRMHGGTRTGPRTPEDLTRSPESKFRKVISRENISLKTCGSRSEDFPFQPNGPQNVDWLGTLRANEPVDHFFRLCRFLARQHVLELASKGTRLAFQSSHPSLIAPTRRASARSAPRLRSSRMGRISVFMKASPPTAAHPFKGQTSLRDALFY